MISGRNTKLILSYEPSQDMVYFFDANDIDPLYRADVYYFLEDVFNGINIISDGPTVGLEIGDAGDVQVIDHIYNDDTIGFYNGDTGEGSIPSSQSILLTNIREENVLTNFDPDTLYSFQIEVQGINYQFSTEGSDLITYADLKEYVESRCPVTIEYIPVTKLLPKFIIKSSVSTIVQTNTDDSDQKTLIRSSKIQILNFANRSYHGDRHIDETGTEDHGKFAQVILDFIRPEAKDILTLVEPNDDTVFSFTVGSAKNLSVRGFQARTYQDLIDTINRFDNVKALYESDENPTITMYVALPKSPQYGSLVIDPNETDPEVITRVSLLRSSLLSYLGNGNTIEIEDLENLSNSNEITHVITNSVTGGYDMLSVVQNSKRANGSYWTEVITIKNSKKSAYDVGLNIPEQSSFFDELSNISTDFIDTDKLRKAAVNLDSVLAFSGLLSGGFGSIDKSLIMDLAIDNLLPFIQSKFLTPPSIPESPTEIGNIQDVVIDDGYNPDAFDEDGNLIDESLLTNAQRSQLIPSPRITVD